MEQHQDTATSNYFTNNDSSNQHALPSFAVETAVPFDFDEWSKKAANAEYPYTPSYASYNSPGSNLSGLSAPLDSADDDFEFMHHTKVGSYGEDLVGLGIHNLGDEDEGYNPHHFSSIAPGAEEFPLIEDQFGNTFVYDAPSNASSPPPHINEPTAYYRPSPDHSPGSSVGDIENPTKSRASSVSSFHRSPRTQSTAPPGFNESLAGLNFGVTSGAESPELHAHRVASPGIISAPIDAPSPPPSSTSPPAPHHAHTKSLTQPLVIPASPSLHPFNSLHNNEHEGESQETAKVVDNMATAAAFSTAFLQPPHDPTFALPRFPVQDSAADNEGPAIRLIPSTPITAGGSVARGVMRPSPLSFVPEDTGANESTFPPPQPDNGSVDPAASWNTQVNAPQSMGYPLPAFERPVATSSWTSDSLLLGGGGSFTNGSPRNQSLNFNDTPNSIPPPGPLPFSAFVQLGHRPRAASHSGSSTPSRGQWQDTSVFPLQQYQQSHLLGQSQRTVNLSEVNPSLTTSLEPFLDSLVPISPAHSHTQLHPENTHLLHHSTPNSPSLLPLNSLHPQGTALRRYRTIATPSGHRRGAWSEDISLNRTVPVDNEAFIRSITSTDGSLLPPDPRSPPARRGRRSSSSSVGSDRGSPYSRPASLSGGSRNPSPIPAGQVERQNVTTPATEAASAIRRKNRAPFMCPVEGCGSTFTRQFNLKGHLRSHREERPYVCKWPKCGKGFARQHDCKRHEALHLNIRPFTCEGCGKTFARMDALNRHHKSEGGIECRKADGSEASNGVAQSTGAFGEVGGCFPGGAGDVGGDLSALGGWNPAAGYLA